jgi:hypothetical protein
VCGAVVEEASREAASCSNAADLLVGSLPKKDFFPVYFGLFNASTFSVFNRLAGAGHLVTRT